jgi:transcription-repair coupling factor (superfamily II helicase)
MEMLEATIEELRGKAVRADVDPEIRLPIPARLPEAYVASVNQRLVLYKRLSSCRDDAEVDGIRDELLDRFGPLPVEAQNLIEVIRLKIVARKLGILAIDAQRGELVVTASDTTTLDPQRLVNLMTQAKSGVRVAPGHKIFAPAPAGEPILLVGAARRLLANLTGG